MQQEAPKEAEMMDQEDGGGPGSGQGAGRGPGDGEVVLSEEQEPDEMQVLEAQVAEWKDLAMRATADLDNFRKRMAREKSDALRYGNQALLEELLPVLDNFEMGLQAAAGEQDSMIFRGMAMVKKQLDEFLNRQGVEEVAAEGQVFDPNVHEAVAQEVSPETEEGQVLRVNRRGYKMRDRLLRPATVVVAKAPDQESASSGEGAAGAEGDRD